VHSSLRLNIIDFLEHDIDENHPCHSANSQTGQLYPETVFETVFTKSTWYLCRKKNGQWSI